MKHWTRPVSLAVAWVFWTGQCMPLAYANKELRPKATDGALQVRQQLSGDLLADRIQAALQEHRLMVNEHQRTVFDIDKLGSYFGGQVPNAAVAAIQQGLAQAQQEQRIAGFQVERIGDSIKLTVESIGPEPSAEVGRLVVEAVAGSVSPQGPQVPGIQSIPDAAVRAKVQEQAEFLGASRVEVVDGSDWNRLIQEAIKESQERQDGKFIDLGNGTYLARSHPLDTARTESRTFVATDDEADKGLIGPGGLNNWRPASGSEGLEQKLDTLQRGAVAGQTLYVIPYLMGPPGSPLERWAAGAQVTPSRYVALQNIIMARLGRPAWEAIERHGAFVPGRHTTGNLETLNRGETRPEDDERHFVTFADDREIEHHGSDYGGNALFGKIPHGLRLASSDAHQNGWLVGQGGLFGLRDTQTGEVSYFGVFKPSGSGKTNLVMTQSSPDDRYQVELLGDDIVWFYRGEDDRVYAINPENGVFGIAPGTNVNTNPSAMAAIGPGTDTIFTNVALNTQTKEVWWEEKTDEYPSDLAHWEDWRGIPITDPKRVEMAVRTVPEKTPDVQAILRTLAAGIVGARRKAEIDQLKQQAVEQLSGLGIQRARAAAWVDTVRTQLLWAQPNSRFTTRLTNFPNVSPEWNSSRGVPISGIIFGGRVTSPREPLVRELRSVEEGVYDGAVMGVETTAAIEGGVQFRSDPMAMTGFFSYPEDQYFEDWRRMMAGSGVRFFHVNWFARDEQGGLLWPGYVENKRVLQWMVDRINGRAADVIETPVGNYPTPATLPLEGLDIPQEHVARLTTYDPAEWQPEMARRTAFFAQFGDRLPTWMWRQHERAVAGVMAPHIVPLIVVPPDGRRVETPGEIVPLLQELFRERRELLTAETPTIARQLSERWDQLAAASVQHQAEGDEVQMGGGTAEPPRRQGSPAFIRQVLTEHPDQWMTVKEIRTAGGVTEVVRGTTQRDLVRLMRDPTLSPGVIRRRRGKEGFAYRYSPELERAEGQVRAPIIGGNWKMAVETREQARQLIRGIAAELKGLEALGAVEVVLFPSSVHLGTVRDALQELEGRGEVPTGRIHLGAQDVSEQKPGAWTGQVSTAQLADLGARYVLVGHSERRRGALQESSELINAKAKTALENGLRVIVAVGENLDERKHGQTQAILEDQLRRSLANLTSEQMRQVVIAYEPVWAIGTGLSATPAQADETQRFIRSLLLERFGQEIAAATRIQYGGSVNPRNIGDLIHQPNIDGGLIGGAALQAGDFVAILGAADTFAKEQAPPVLAVAGHPAPVLAYSSLGATDRALIDGIVDDAAAREILAGFYLGLREPSEAVEELTGLGTDPGLAEAYVLRASRPPAMVDSVRRGGEGTGVAVESGVRAAFPELFGNHTINGRTVNVEETIATLTRDLEPEIVRALTARRELLESDAPVREQYAWPAWNKEFRDADGNVRTFREIVQGMIDNFLGHDTPLAWRLNDNVPVPDDANPLTNIGLELTGPWHPIDMAMNQLNADVAAIMPDLEDASPAWFVPFGASGDEPVGAFAGLQNAKELFEGRWNGQTYRVTKRGAPREYRINKPRDQWPTVFQRVPGIHLQDAHITLNGKPVPAIVIASAIHVLNNYGSLKKADSGAYYYEPKTLTPQEALIAEHLLRHLEDLAGVPHGTIKIAMLYEEGVAGLYLPAIAWIWKDRLVKWSDGRWDYLGSLIEMWKDEAVFPDPQMIGMASPSMMAYQRYSALMMLMMGMKHGQLTQGGKVGGMAAVMTYPPTDPYGRWKYNPIAFRGIKIDKLRERLSHLIFVPDEPLPEGQQPTLEQILARQVKGRFYDFLRQSWVASPEPAYVAAGNGPLRADVADLPAIVSAPTETVEIDGKPVPTVTSGLVPAELDVFQRRGLLNPEGKITPWVITKDMFDTPEKIFTQERWDSIYGVPQGEITIERLQHSLYMAANYNFQILNGNLAAAIDDYELHLRFMNDLATYRKDMSWLWTALRHGAVITQDGYLKRPALTEDGVVPAVNAEEIKAGTRFTPELFEKLWNYHNEWTEAFFKEQDRLAEQDPTRAPRFDRSKAPIIMDILKRQLLAPRYIQHSARVLFAVAEADETEREQYLRAIFAPSREAVVAEVEAGTLPAKALEVHDYIYDIFPPEEPAGSDRGASPRPYATLDDMVVEGLTVLVRPDLNVSALNGHILNPETPHERVVAAAETVRELAERGAKVVVIFHQGRPGGPDLMDTPDEHAAQLSRLVGRPVKPVNDLFGDEALAAIRSLQPGQIVMLKPVRAQDPATGKTLEENPAFVERLEQEIGLFVIDGFSVAHRPSVSVTGFARTPTVAGRLMVRELEGAAALVDLPQPSLVAVGGGKVEEKLTELKAALSREPASTVVVGGRLANLALIANQPEVPTTTSADDLYTLAVRTVGQATADDLRTSLGEVPELATLLAAHREHVVLPTDMVYLDGQTRQVVTLQEGRVPAGFNHVLSGIGPSTAQAYAAVARRTEQPFASALVLGPLSDSRYDVLLAEMDEVLRAISERIPFWATGGGDTEQVVKTRGFTPTYTSLAGGALAEYKAGVAEGKELPGVAILIDRHPDVFNLRRTVLSGIDVEPIAATPDGMTFRARARTADGTVGRWYGLPAGTSTGDEEARTVGLEQARANMRRMVADTRRLGISADDIVAIHERVVVPLNDSLARQANRAPQRYGGVGGDAALPLEAAVLYAVADAWHMEPADRLRELFPEAAGEGTTYPLSVVWSGGAHVEEGDYGVDKFSIQELLIDPSDAPSLEEATRMVQRIRQAVADALTAKGIDPGESKEGGVAPRGIGSVREAIGIIVEAAEQAGYAVGRDFHLRFDAAANTFYDAASQRYNVDGQRLDREGVVQFYKALDAAFPGVIRGIEDPFAESDHEGWRRIKQELPDWVRVADDLTATQLDLTEAYQDLYDVELIKPNQAGSLVDTMRVIALAKRLGKGVILSHRSREAGRTLEEADVLIAQIADAVGASYLKTMPWQPVRTAKVTELSRLAAQRQAGKRQALADLPYLEQVEALGIRVADEAALSLRQGLWVPQFPNALSYTVSENVARQAADLSRTRWVVVHSSVYTDAPDAAMAHARIQRQVRRILQEGESAINFALVVDGASTAEQAEAAVEALVEALPEASAQTGQTGQLTRADFRAVVPGTTGAVALIRQLEASVPESAIGSVIGPSDWAQAVKAASGSREAVTAIAVEVVGSEATVAGAAEALIAGVEAAAAGGRLNPEVAAKLKLLEDAGVVVPSTANIAQEVADAVRNFRSTIRAALRKV